MNDEALMRAVRDGNVGKLGILFERHHVALFDFLSRMTGDRTMAEDLTQDVFLRMLEYRSTFRDDGHFETWMFHIARNPRTDYFRRRAAIELNVEGIEAVANAPGPAHMVERDQQAALLRCALLSRDDRASEIVKPQPGGPAASRRRAPRRLACARRLRGVELVMLACAQE